MPPFISYLSAKFSKRLLVKGSAFSAKSRTRRASAL
jgi:hypothetical protein